METIKFIAATLEELTGLVPYNGKEFMVFILAVIKNLCILAVLLALGSVIGLAFMTVAHFIGLTPVATIVAVLIILAIFAAYTEIDIP